MDTWTRQMGFPLVTIKRENTSGDPTGVISAVQSRFLLTADVPNITTIRQPPSTFKYRWYIPLNYYTNQGHYNNVNTVWMNMTNSKLEINFFMWLSLGLNFKTKCKYFQ